jgi:hypothetical protein
MVFFVDLAKTASFTEVEVDGDDDDVDLLDSHSHPLNNEKFAN